MMHILYISAYPKSYYREVVQLNPSAVAPASQKFNSLLVKGIRQNHIPLEVLCTQDVLSALRNRKSHASFDLEEDEIVYHFPPYSSNRIINYLKTARFIEHTIRRFQSRYSDSVILFDYLMPHIRNAASSFRKSAVIITDLPEFMYVSSKVTRNQKLIDSAYKMIDHADCLILLTKEMRERLPRSNQPYLVLEGMTDSDIKPVATAKERRKAILYAGAVSYECGINHLVNAFIKLNSDYELLIFGIGNYVPELKKLADQNPRLRYLGMADNQEIVKLEQEVSLLVNPRPINQDFSRYSFPSKNMEYMASATPLLTTRLTGMPDEYCDYVYLFPSDDENGIYTGLKNTLSISSEALLRKGAEAQQFVLSRKNCRIQAQNVAEFIKHNKISG